MACSDRILALPVVLFLHWYYLTRALAAICRPFWPRLYPSIAAAAFLVHALIAFVRLKPDITPEAQAMGIPFIAVGTCIVYVCAFMGNRILRNWSHPNEPRIPFTTNRLTTNH
jgi:hypothetical protein